VSDYRQDDRATGIRSPGEAEDFSSSLCVQTSSEAHPPSYPLGAVAKAGPGGDVMLTPNPTYCRGEEGVGANLLSPCQLHGGSGTALFYFTLLARDECE
jgi:hypothetical protein